MASKSFRNVTSVLALAEGIAIQIEQEYRKRQQNKTVLMLCARLKTACHAAHKEWGGELDAKDLEQIARRMNAVEKQSSMGGKAEPATYCGFALGCISDLFSYIKDPVRISALDDLNRALMRLNRYFDKDLKRHDCYEAAGKAVDVWMRESIA